MTPGEFELIDRIRQYARDGEEQLLGIGDDCSVLQIPDGYDLLTSTDLLLDAVHFNLDWTSLEQLGRKAIAVNVSDIAAMGGRPLAIYLGLGLPQTISPDQLELFMSGVRTALDEYGLFLSGGDTCRSMHGLTIAVTVQGVCRTGQQVTRKGARPGEDLWVSGCLGDSALALELFQSGRTPTPYLRTRHLTPQPPVALGRILAEQSLATAMLDLSDGLTGDLLHLIGSSGVGARIDLDSIPLSEEFSAALAENRTHIDLALGGGEDYELLFSAVPAHREQIESLSQKLGLRLSRIGRVTEGAAAEYFDANGKPYQPERAGFDHFASNEGHQSG